jgi:hypothetical protein
MRNTKVFKLVFENSCVVLTMIGIPAYQMDNQKTCNCIGPQGQSIVDRQTGLLLLQIFHFPESGHWYSMLESCSAWLTCKKAHHWQFEFGE